MQEILSWLSGTQDYESGAALYAKYGNSNFLKGLFAGGPTPFNLTKLWAELQKLAPATPAIPTTKKSVQPPASNSQQVEIPQHPLRQPNVADHEQFLELQKQIKNTYRQMERNMAALELLPANRESALHQTALQILALYEKNRKQWSDHDFYVENGYFKKPAQIKTDKIQRLRVSISKAEQRLKSKNCKNPEQTKKLIQDNKALIAMIKAGGSGE